MLTCLPPNTGTKANIFFFYIKEKKTTKKNIQVSHLFIPINRGPYAKQENTYMIIKIQITYIQLDAYNMAQKKVTRTQNEIHGTYTQLGIHNIEEKKTRSHTHKQKK